MSERQGPLERFPTRTWPLGTRKRVEVVTVGVARGWQIVSVVEANPPGGGAPQGFILCETAGTYQVEPGQTVMMTYTKGGPTGAYWKIDQKWARPS